MGIRASFDLNIRKRNAEIEDIEFQRHLSSYINNEFANDIKKFKGFRFSNRETNSLKTAILEIKFSKYNENENYEYKTNFHEEFELIIFQCFNNELGNRNLFKKFLDKFFLNRVLLKTECKILSNRIIEWIYTSQQNELIQSILNNPKFLE